MKDILDALDNIIGKLGAARAQRAESDDKIIGARIDRAYGAAVALRRKIENEPCCLVAVVQYRGKEPDVSPVLWRTMAAFDSALAAERYAVNCGKDDETWEYRAVEVAP